MRLPIVLLFLVFGCSSNGEAAPTPRPSKPLPVAVQPTCIRADERLFFHAVIPTVYTKPERSTSRRIWQFFCSLETMQCKGSTLRLDSLDQGKPINFMDLDRCDGATVKVTGSVATISWGPLRTFTVDFASNEITFVESGQGLTGPVEGRGRASCIE